MSFELTTVCHPTSDISKPAVFLKDSVSSQRQLIGNVPEGIQRRCFEQRLRLSRLDTIILTGVLDWKSIGGLPGTILTVSDLGLKKLGVYHSGNKILQYMMSTWRYFVFRFGLDLKADDIQPEGLNTGRAIFKPINIKSSAHGEAASLVTENHIKAHVKLSRLISSIFPIVIQEGLKNISNFTLPKIIKNPMVSANIIMTGVPIRGKFLPEQAIALGCPRQSFKTLCKFEQVTLENGTVITPDQVLEPTRTFDSVLFLDIPSESYLDNTINHNWQNEIDKQQKYCIVYHFLDESLKNILETEKYKSFIKSFGPEAIHFISHKQYVPNTLNFEKSYELSFKWACLMKDQFPLFKWSSKPLLSIPTDLSNVYPMVAGQQVRVNSSSPVVLDMDLVNGIGHPPSHYETVYNEQVAPLDLHGAVSKERMMTFVGDAENGNQKTLKTSVDQNVPLQEQVETIVLGTGSALPATLRNVISNMVRLPYVNQETGEKEFRSIFLDAGENTLGTLKRLFNEDEVSMLFGELKLIYLSHLHADHHIGIASIIQRWNEEMMKRPVDKREKLFIVTPWQYPKFISELNRVDEIFCDLSMMEYLSCDEFNRSSSKYALPEFKQFDIDEINAEDLDKTVREPTPFVRNPELSNSLLESLNIKSFATCYAHHCEYSYSCSIDFKLSQNESFKVSYSGDSRPTFFFKTIGSNSELLIHESTLEDNKFDDAVIKKHSTTSEAVQIGILMKAKKILLTHFSQRYKSFTASEDVYQRLAIPVTRSQQIKQVYGGSDSENSNDSLEDDEVMTPLTERLQQERLLENKLAPTTSTVEEDTPLIPIEERSNVFKYNLTEAMYQNSKTIEIVFAFDNMYIEYGKFNLQREVFEKQGEKLQSLFNLEGKQEEDQENDLDNDDNNEEESEKAVKKSKKQKNGGGGESTKRKKKEVEDDSSSNANNTNSSNKKKKRVNLFATLQSDGVCI